VQALARPEGQAREQVLHGYAAALDAEYGGYFTLGRVFAKMIGNPTFMKQATKYGLPRTSLMRFTLKLMANLRDPYDGDVSDRVINALARIAPAA
jgi:menaquinone-9 beta-reductase